MRPARPLSYASVPPRGKCLIVLASLGPVTFYIIGFLRDVNTLFNLNICALAENLLRSGWGHFTMFGLGGLRDGDILFVLNICALTETIRFFTDELNYTSL